MAQHPLPTEALERALEIIESFIDFLHFGDELAVVDLNPTATTTGQCAVALKPSNRLLRLTAALCAWNGDFCSIEHMGSPSC